METQETQLMKLTTEAGLSETKSQQILQQFNDFFSVASEWERKAKQIVITDIVQVSEMKMAEEGRKQLSKIRNAVEKKRKELKEDSLREGRLIDGIARILKDLIEPTEKYLYEQENFIKLKQHAYAMELKSKREAELIPLGVEVDKFDLGYMPEPVYQELLQSAQKIFQDKLEEIRLEHEKKLKEERQRAEQEAKLKAENERLRAEKREAQRKQAELDNQRKLEEAERLRKERAYTNEKLRIEKEKREALEKVLAEQEAERIKQQREARRLKNAPDVEKIEHYVARIMELEVPVTPISKNIIKLRDEFTDNLLSEINKLNQ